MIAEYTFIQWLAFFFIYCFFGWCIESTIVSYSKKKLINRGFLKGPFLPLYGSGALVMLVSTLWVKDNIILVYAIGLVGATCLEYITGMLMEALLQMRYWDYSKKRFNINGYICLTSSLFWGVLTVFLVKVIHGPIARQVESLDQNLLTIIVFFVAGAVMIDCVHAFKEAFSLQKFLKYQTRVRDEISEISSKIAEFRDSIASIRAEREGMMLEEKIAGLEKYIEKLKMELENGKEKVLSLNLSVIKSFPSATSRKFNDALQDLKEYFNK